MIFVITALVINCGWGVRGNDISCGEKVGNILEIFGNIRFWPDIILLLSDFIRMPNKIIRRIIKNKTIKDGDIAPWKDLKK